MRRRMNSTPKPGRGCFAKRPRSACCRFICRAGSRRRAAILQQIVASASEAGLYTNLITSGIGLSDATLDALADGGLDHVQISIQDCEPASADRIAGYDGAFVRKRALAERVVAAWSAADRQHRRASHQHRSHRRHGRPRAVARCQPGRDRACAILRLGAEEPCGADADARAGVAARSRWWRNSGKRITAAS